MTQFRVGLLLVVVLFIYVYLIRFHPVIALSPKFRIALPSHIDLIIFCQWLRVLSSKIGLLTIFEGSVVLLLVLLFATQQRTAIEIGIRDVFCALSV
jgi:hypothetical protein